MTALIAESVKKLACNEIILKAMAQVSFDLGSSRWIMELPGMKKEEMLFTRFT
jgi:hypothetical protein